MNAVGRLVGHDDVRLHRLEEAVHLVVLFIHPEPRLVLHDIALRDSGRPDICPAVACDPELVELVPVEVEVLFVQGGVLEVHVVVARETEDTGVLLQRDDVLQDLVFLLHDPPRPDRVLLVGRPLPLRRLRDFGTFEKLVNKILNPHVGFSHPPPQAVEIGLKLVVTDGRAHVVEGNIDQVAGDDVGIGNCLKQQRLDPLEGAVDVGRVDQLHACYRPITSRPFRDNLDPVVVRIMDEINAHLHVFIADTSHLLMQGMRGGKIVDNQRQMEFVVAQVVGFLSIPHPGKFQLMAGLAVTEKDENEAPVGGLFPPDLLELERLLVKLHALFQVEDIEIVVGKPKFHGCSPFRSTMGLFDAHERLPALQLRFPGKTQLREKLFDSPLVKTEVGVDLSLIGQRGEDVLRIVASQEGANRPVFRLKPFRKGHGSFHVIVAGINDGFIGKLHQFPDGMVEAFDIAGKAVPDCAVEEGVAPEQDFIDMETTRFFRMTGCMDDPDIAAVQRNLAAIRKIRPAQKAGMRGLKQRSVAACVIVVVMGVDDILQRDLTLPEKGKYAVRGAAINGHTAFRSINEISKIVGVVTKLFNLQHENTLFTFCNRSAPCGTSPRVSSTI